MTDAEKKIRSMIRPGKAARIILWSSLLLTVVLILVGSVFQLLKSTVEAEKFDAMNSPKETYSYIDVVGVSDWCYEYTYDSTTTTFYVVEDTDGYLSFATIEPKDFTHMRAQRQYWEGKTEVAPEPYRITGQSWPLDPSTKTWTELYKVSGVESADEFENWFGKMYLSGGYNPMGEVGSGFYLAAIFTGLFWVIMLMCVAPQMIKMEKSIRALKKEDRLETAADELEVSQEVGPCSVSANYFFVQRRGIAIPLSSIKNCVAYSNSVRLSTDTLGDMVIPDLKPGVSSEVLAALPLGDETVEVVCMKSR